MKDEDRYWQPIHCELCKTLMGWAPYARNAYQCINCNNLPEDWDAQRLWLKRHDKQHED